MKGWKDREGGGLEASGVWRMKGEGKKGWRVKGRRDGEMEGWRDPEGERREKTPGVKAGRRVSVASSLALR